MVVEWRAWRLQIVQLQVEIVHSRVVSCHAARRVVRTRLLCTVPLPNCRAGTPTTLSRAFRGYTSTSLQRYFQKTTPALNAWQSLNQKSPRSPLGPLITQSSALDIYLFTTFFETLLKLQVGQYLKLTKSLLYFSSVIEKLQPLAVTISM